MDIVSGAAVDSLSEKIRAVAVDAGIIAHQRALGLVGQRTPGDAEEVEALVLRTRAYRGFPPPRKKPITAQARRTKKRGRT